MAATTTATKASTGTRTRKEPVAIDVRMKTQLTNAVLREKISPTQLGDLEAHIAKLKSFTTSKA